MSNESFISASEVLNVITDIPKYENDNTITIDNHITNKKSNSNPGTFRSDSSSTITNVDIKSVISQLPQKSLSLNADGGSISNTRKNGKKSYSIRSTKASRAREELNKKKERQSIITTTPFLRSQLNNVPALKIPIRKVPSCTNIKSTPDLVKTVTKQSPKTNNPTKLEHVKTNMTPTTPESIRDRIKSPVKLRMSPADESAKGVLSSPTNTFLSLTPERTNATKQSFVNVDNNMSPTNETVKLPTSPGNSATEISRAPANDPTMETTALDALKIPNTKTPDFRNVVKAKFKTMTTKLGSPSVVIEKSQQDQGDCNELINKYKRELSFRQRMTTALRIKQAEKNDNKLKESRTKHERKFPENLSRIKENEQSRTCNKEIVNNCLVDKNKTAGNYLPISENNIGDNELIAQRTKEDKRQEFSISDKPLNKRRPHKFSLSQKQLKESESSGRKEVTHIHPDIEQPLCEAEVGVKPVEPIPDDSTMALVDKLKNELLTAYAENANLEKQLRDVIEELNNANMKLKIAESTVEHLKTQQQAQLMSLSKRVAEVDELMSTAVAERELWKARATTLEKDLKNKVQSEAKTQADNRQKRESKRPEENRIPGAGNSTEITHREERIHTADERRGEKKQKTIIKILKTVKKVQLTPEMYDKISYHP